MKLFHVWIAALLLFVISCSKPEGEGGKSSITGKIFFIDYPSSESNQLDTIPASDEDVYIVYGNGTLQDDDTKTNYEGKYAFNYLRTGDYSIFVYGRNPDSAEIKVPQVYNFSIGKKEDFAAPDIYIYGSSDGHSTVKGKVYIKDYDAGGLPKGIEFLGADVDVYIARKGDEVFFDRTRTHYDGSFIFSRLTRGEYYVYAYTRDIATLPPSAIPTIVKQEFTIDAFAQIAILDTLTIID